MLVAASVLAMVGPTPASADESDPLDAIADVVPSVLTDASDVEADEVTTAGQLDIVVPSDASEGVSVVAPGVTDLAIGLPFASQAELVDSGSHAYFDNGNGSSTVPLVKEDGTVQILTTIDNAAAPNAYSYDLDVASGSSLALTAAGGAEVTDADGNVILALAEPWAIDANGSPVPTHYTVVGTALVQVVEFNASTAFPVVADPSVTVGRSIYIYLNKTDQTALKNGLAAAITAGVCALPAVGWGTCVAVAAVVAIGATYIARNGFCSGAKPTLELRTAGFGQSAGAKCVKR